MGEATNFKFGVQIGYKECYQKCKNKGQKRRGLGHVTNFYILELPHYNNNKCKKTSVLQQRVRPIHTYKTAKIKFVNSFPWI